MTFEKVLYSKCKPLHTESKGYGLKKKKKTLLVHLFSDYLIFPQPYGDFKRVFTIARTWEQPRCPATDERIKKLCTDIQ